MQDLSQEILHDMLDELHDDLVRRVIPSQDRSEPTSHCVWYALCYRDMDAPAVPSTGYHSVDGGAEVQPRPHTKMWANAESQEGFGV